MSRFKVGQTVYMGRGDKMQTLIVEKVIDNPVVPVYQYSFEGHDFACGEQSIRDTPDGRDLSLSECFKKNNEEIGRQISTYFNTVANVFEKTLFEDADDNPFIKADLSDVNNNKVFFKPNFKFCQWLKEYANNRIIIDVGCGQGHLVRMLKKVGARVIGFEPNFNSLQYQKYCIKFNNGEGLNDIMEYTINDAQHLIKGFHKSVGVLLIFARPCHSDFVYDGVRQMVEGMEALYITLPENLEICDDLGSYKSKAVKLEHEGVSEDNEVVYSIKC